MRLNVVVIRLSDETAHDAKKLGVPVMLKPTLIRVCLEQLHRRAPPLLGCLAEVITGQFLMRLVEESPTLLHVFLVAAVRGRHAISIDA